MPKLLAKRFTPLGWASVGLGVSLMVLAVLGAVNVQFSAFFPLISLWYNCFLLVCALWVLRVADVRMDLFHWSVLICLWAGAVIYFQWALSRRDFVYTWDYSNYLIRQYNAEAAFASGSYAGYAYIFGSLADDYTNFITLFTEFPFCLTSRTGDAYAFSQVFSIVPSMLLLMAGMVRKAGQMLQVKHRFWYFLIGLSWCFTWPYVRMSATLAQPDWLGLTFAFAILVLTLDYRFARWEPGRLALLFGATACLVITRRWYLYFIVAYYFAYALLVIISSLRSRKAGDAAAVSQIRRLIAFGLGSVVAMVALFWPMVRNILSYDYADHYAFYNVGGFSLELVYQSLRLGGLNLILIVIGLVFLWRKKAPALPCLAGCTLLVSLILFTRVQNSGSHQMLLFVPAWLLLFLAGAAALAEGIDQRRALKLAYWAFTLVFAVSVRCSPLTTLALPDVIINHISLASTAELYRLDKLTYDREDLPQLQAIAAWLDEYLEEDEKAYMIPNDMLYNPDHLRNCNLPDRPLTVNRLTESFSVPGTHSFPTQFFEAKYVLSADPHPNTFNGDGELSQILNARFLAVCEDHFEPVARFDMGNGTTFTIWVRTKEPTRAEVEYYLDAFSEQDAQYPEMFSQVAEAWLTARGL